MEFRWRRSPASAAETGVIRLGIEALQSIGPAGVQAHLLRWRGAVRGREGRLDDVIGLPGRWALLGRILKAVIYQLRYGQRALLRHLHANFLGMPQALVMHVHDAHVMLMQ